MNNGTAHPYMANSVPAIKREMLDAIGVETIEELFEQIPSEHRPQRPIDLPPALTESEPRRHMVTTLAEQDRRENFNFLGAGCWQHRQCLLPATRSCAATNG